MNPKRSLFFASLLCLSFLAACEEIPDHSACEQKLDGVKIELEGKLDSMSNVVDDVRSQNEKLSIDLSNTRDSLRTLQNAKQVPKIPERIPKGDPIRLDGPKPGTLPNGRK